jgi:hypothetical protein
MDEVMVSVRFVVAEAHRLAVPRSTVNVPLSTGVP